MFGYNKSYEELLRESGLDTLMARRIRAITKFAKNCVSNLVYSSWFPENTNRQSQRRTKKYEEKMARTNRPYNSPLYVCRRALNDSEYAEPETETAWDYNLNDPFAN